MPPDKDLKSPSLLRRLHFAAQGMAATPRFRELGKNAGTLLSGNIAAALIGLATFSLTARSLEPDAFGVLVLAVTYGTIVDAFVKFQSWQALIRFGATAQQRRDTAELGGLFKLGLLLDCSTAAAGAAIGFVLAPTVGRMLGISPADSHLLAIFSLSLVFNWSGVPTAALRLYGRFSLAATHQMIAAAIRLLCVLIAVVCGADLFWLVVVWASSTAAGNLLLFLFGIRVLAVNGLAGWWKQGLGNWREPLKFASWTNLTSTLDLPARHLDVMFVGALAPVEFVGVYKLIKEVRHAVVRLVDPVYQAIFPQFASQIASGKLQEAVRDAFKVGVVLACVLLPVVVLAAITSPWWLAALLGWDPRGSVLAANVYLSALPFVAMMIPIHPLVVAMGYARLNTVIVLVTNLLYCGISIGLGILCGITGIASAYIIHVLIIGAWKCSVVLKRSSSARSIDSQKILSADSGTA